MSFAAVQFPTGSYVVTRTEVGAFTDGRYTSGSANTFIIVADVQDVTGDELRDLPEGRRADEVRVVYTNVELSAGKPATPQASGPDEPALEPDTIEIDGERWRVFRVQRFRVFASRWRAWIERYA